MQSIGGARLAALLGDLPAGGPRYAALADVLRRLVLDGRLSPSIRLPAERGLAAALGVSRTTVTAAYDVLREQGYLESRRGSGSRTALPSTPLRAPGDPAGVHGTDETLLDLGCVAPPAPPGFDEAVAAAVAELPRHTTGHGYEPAGLRSLREAIARRYTERGLATLPEQVFVTAGAQHGLGLVLRALVRSGDAVLVESPTYPHALGAVRRTGARLVPVGVETGWDMDFVAAGMRQSAVRLAYTIPDFHNPTGYLMGDGERAALVAAARDVGAYLVVDESFAELALDDLAPVRPTAVHDHEGHVISIGSAAKIFWGGLRVGWVRTTRALVARLVEVREEVDLASPVLEQLIVAALMTHVDDVVAERRSILRRHRTALVEALADHCPDWTFTMPSGGLSLWVRLPRPIGTALARTARGHGVHIVPGPAFSADGVLDGRLRLPYVLPPRELRDAVRRLASAYRVAASAPTPATPPAYV